MVWDKRVRAAGWAAFFFMWVPLCVLIYAGVTDGDEETIVVPMRLFFFLCILSAVLLFGSFFIGRYEKRRIRMIGIPATATITGITETGMTVNDQPLIRIGLEVHPPYDTPFATTVEYLLPYFDREQLQPGKKVPVFWIEGTQEVALDGL